MASVNNKSFVRDNNRPDRKGDNKDDMKFVIKNTFLEVIDGNTQEELYGSRKRASSDSRLHTKYEVYLPSSMSNSKCEKEESVSNSGDSTPSLVNDIASLYSVTPRAISKESWFFASNSTLDSLDFKENGHSQSKSPLSSSGPPSFEITIDERKDWATYSEEDDGHHVPAEVRETLNKLTQIVGEEHCKREDLENHELTEILYPWIPLDEEGNVTSLGSILHSEGTCKPCAFLKKDRCHKKDLCIYCHCAHDLAAPKPTRFRKSKKKRMRQQRHRCVPGERQVPQEFYFDEMEAWAECVDDDDVTDTEKYSLTLGARISI